MTVARPARGHLALVTEQLPSTLDPAASDEFDGTALGAGWSWAPDPAPLPGSKPRVEDWLGVQIGEDLDGVKLSFNAPNGMPGLDAVVFNSPGRGVVRI